MPSIIDTVILCGHFGVPLRGHRDDNQSHPKDGEYSKIPGVGNFVELLNFAIGRGDKHLEDHYNTHAGNATFQRQLKMKSSIFLEMLFWIR